MTEMTEIPSALARALEAKGFDQLTPVQTAVLDPELAGRDLLVSAQTGSGKTVGFGLAMATDLLGDAPAFGEAGAPLALVIAPTRELAIQVRDELRWLYSEAETRIASCVGGMDPRAERRTLEHGAHIVVGTPGRLRDHIERGALDLSQLNIAVLDEADEMLDMGFREDLEFILDAAPEERRTLLFSATVPRAIERLAETYQRDAARLTLKGSGDQHADIDYKVLSVTAADRENALINLLRFQDAESAIVFCTTRESVNRLSARLGNRGFSVVALSGELDQAARTHALQAMRDKRARVCVATDVAARGIDLPGLELVIHADLPNNSDTLLHRSGRTGRAGRKGMCAMIVPHNQRNKAARLLRFAKIEAEWGAPPSLEEIEARDRERWLADPVLTTPPAESDAPLIADLIEKFGPEVLAAAFIAAKKASEPAAEELSSNFTMGAPVQGERRERPAPGPQFEGGVWYKASVGRKHRAEPRWLLPMICKLGGITRKQVGRIEIREGESRFEIAPDVAERFASSLAEAGGGEGKVKVSLTQPGEEGAAPEAAEAPRPPRKPRKEKPYGDKPYAAKPRPRRPDGEEGEVRKPRREFDDRKRASAPSEDGERPPKRKFERKPERREDGERKFERKPKTDRFEKPARRASPLEAPQRPEGVTQPDEGPRLRRIQRKDGPAKGPRAFKSDAPSEGRREESGEKRGGKPFGRPGGKPFGKPGAKSYGKPGGKPSGKPGGKRPGKPGAKPGGKPGFKRKGPPQSGS